MKKLLYCIKREYYKLWDITGMGDDRSVADHRKKGKFRVKYRDGEISQPFSWRVANEYKEMFGGEVIDNF